MAKHVSIENELSMDWLSIGKKSIPWLSLAAMLMYATSVFQIADNHIILAAICFVVGTSFAAASGVLEKKFKNGEEASSDDN